MYPQNELGKHIQNYNEDHRNIGSDWQFSPGFPLYDWKLWICSPDIPDPHRGIWKLFLIQIHHITTKSHPKQPLFAVNLKGLDAFSGCFDTQKPPPSGQPTPSKEPHEGNEWPRGNLKKKERENFPAPGFSHLLSERRSAQKFYCGAGAGRMKVGISRGPTNSGRSEGGVPWMKTPKW